jgi:FMN phosphatase YigB (HAD superfamily)/DNA-binding XRE family transcriptional regulator
MVEVERVLGQAIQQARQTAGLTQQELCHQAGMSYSTLAKIERGAIKTPSVFTVARIASVLGTTLDSLLDNVDSGISSVVSKKKSKSGISFLYVDINGCLVHFFHSAFSRLSQETGISGDVIESTFWHFNDAVCRGEITLDEFNNKLAEKLNISSISWEDYYMTAVEPIHEMHQLITWASQNFKVGLLSNIMPGFIDKMIKTGLLPDINYDAIIDSSVVKAIKPETNIYKIAEKQAKVAPNEILFVDDSRTNLMAAENQGWRVLWFDDMSPAESVARVKSALEIA